MKWGKIGRFFDTSGKIAACIVAMISLTSVLFAYIVDWGGDSQDDPPVVSERHAQAQNLQIVEKAIETIAFRLASKGHIQLELERYINTPNEVNWGTVVNFHRQINDEFHRIDDLMKHDIGRFAFSHTFAYDKMISSMQMQKSLSAFFESIGDPPHNPDQLARLDAAIIDYRRMADDMQDARRGLQDYRQNL